MTRMLRRNIRRNCAMALAALMLVSMPCTKTLAAEETVTVNENVKELNAELVDFSKETPDGMEAALRATTFSETDIVITMGSGEMTIDLSTATTKLASRIGVKDIKIQKSVWYGWDTLYTSNGGELTGVSTAVYRITCSAEDGATYRILCTHYADVDGYKEYANDSGSFVFTSN